MRMIEQRSYPLTVDYAQSLMDMIAVGRYDDVNGYITPASFPIIGTGIVETEVVLVHFNRYISSSDDAICEIKALGLEPAKIEYCLAFGAKYPDVQREFQIAFLGSPLVYRYNERYFLCLDGGSGVRLLRLPWYWRNWGVDWRFAAVRKQPVL